MKRKVIDKVQRPLFFIAIGALMIGFVMKAYLSAGYPMNYIIMEVFIDNLATAPFFAWVYWSCITIFLINLLALMIFEYLKRLQ